MSLTSPVRPALGRLLPAALLAASVFVLPSCSSSNSDGDATPVDVTSIIELIVSTGSGMRGVEAKVSFDLSMTVDSVQAVGSFSGQTCESNVGSNFALLLCARDDASTFDAPQTLWRLTVGHSSAVNPLDLVFDLSCLASDPLGNTFPVACSLE